MSTPPLSAASPDAPATGEFTAAWAAYITYALASVLIWPALVGLIINYSKRGRPEAGFIDTHHRWMLRSFWWALLFMVLSYCVMIVGLWPLISDVLSQAIHVRDWDDASVIINIDWRSIFGTIGGAMLGGIMLMVNWFWYVYRTARGMITLADARPLP